MISLATYLDREECLKGAIGKVVDLSKKIPTSEHRLVTIILSLKQIVIVFISTGPRQNSRQPHESYGYGFRRGNGRIDRHFIPVRKS